MSDTITILGQNMTEGPINTKLLEELKEFIKERKITDQKDAELYARSRKFPRCRGVPPAVGSKVYHLKKGPGEITESGNNYVQVKFEDERDKCTVFEWTDLIDLTVITLFGRQLTLEPSGGYYYCKEEKPFLYVHEPMRGPNGTKEWKASVNCSFGPLQGSGCCVEEAEDLLKGQIAARCREILEEVDQLRALTRKE